MFVALPLLSKLDEAKTKNEFKETIESAKKMIPVPPGVGPGGPGGPGAPGVPGGFPGFPFPGFGK
jgi:hypothetical protein